MSKGCQTSVVEHPNAIPFHWFLSLQVDLRCHLTFVNTSQKWYFDIQYLMVPHYVHLCPDKLALLWPRYLPTFPNLKRWQSCCFIEFDCLKGSELLKYWNSPVIVINWHEFLEHPAGASVISSSIRNFCSNFNMGIYENFFYIGKYILKHK